MATLQDLANLAEIAGVLLVVGAIGFALVEVREHRRSRHESTSWTALLAPLQGGFMEAVATVHALPKGWEKAGLGSLDLRERTAVMTVYQQMENLGVALRAKVLDRDLLVRAYGTGINAAWRVLAPYVLATRGSEPAFGRHFEYMVQVVEAHEPGVVAAWER